MIEATKPLAEGMLAFHDRVSPDACPYPLSSKACTEWLNGWNLALQSKATKARHEKRPDARPAQTTDPSA